MVSFHCDACTDVVKKPKLDHHYGQCRSSFTCIDCSKTFQGPTQWKAHTSCVTEAEKYQKSLYEGPKKGSRPANGRRTDFTPKTMNASGKYRQSLSTQSGWSRHQTIRNCASGANSTPLGSPLRMSPVDTSAVEPSLSTANTTSVTERGEGTKGDSGAAVMSHTSNEAEPKEKKKRKHDTPREHATADELPAKVNGSSEKRKGGEKSGDESQSKTQPATDDIPGNSADKKVKKRKKEKREEVDEENNGPAESVAPRADDNAKAKDEKRGKKRKHKEDLQANQGEGQEDSREKKRKKKNSCVGT